MIYNIVLNSNNISSGIPCNGIHYFDWTVLPESQYKVTFSFMSGFQSLANMPSIPTLYVDLGQNTVFTSSLNSSIAKQTQFIGMLFPNFINANSYLCTTKESTSTIYLSSRPNSNQFNVRILNNVTNANWIDNNNNLITNYVLNLTFETV